MARMVLMGLCVVVTCMVVAAPYAEAALTCTQVATNIAPCIGYLTTGGSVPPASCCNGIVALNASATTTTADLQATCECLQRIGSSVPGINFDVSATLPGECGVDLAFAVSADTDCSQVQ